jgi:ATP-dependent DNA helicase DinG
VNALSPALDLAPTLVVLPGGRCALADGAGSREVSAEAARAVFADGPALVAHAGITAQRLGLRTPPRAPRLFDALELWAFARPARFCAPTAAGLAMAAGLPEPRGAEAQASALREVVTLLLVELASRPTPSRDEALAQAETLGRAGWAWAPAAIGALRSGPLGRPWRGAGLDVWSRLAEWEDEGPPGEPGSEPLDPVAAQARLAELLGRAELAEARPAQAQFAGEAAHAFQPREREGEPMMMLAEAGTGVGKTLGYLAPASLWAEANGPAVWISTYTRALQRQIARESAALFPDPAVRARKAVVRKGRENYLCLLNFQEAVNAAQLGGGDRSASASPPAGRERRRTAT